VPAVSLADKLSALTAPTPGGGAATAARRGAPQYPRGWEPGVKYDPSGAMTVTTPTVEPLTGDEAAWKGMVEALGLEVPEGWRVRLVEAKYDPAAWHRDTPGDDAVTRPVWRYRFAVEQDLAAAATRDIDDLVARVKASRGKARVAAEAPADARAFVVAVGDTQIGKGDGDGAEGTVGRVLASIDAQAARLRELRKLGRPIGPVYLLWLGDCVEGFVSQGGGNAWRTPMTLTEQVRVVRRLMLHQVETFRGLTDQLVLASVPGNHDEAVRFGKGITRYDDSWAVEAAVQVGDALAVNPAAYGHVSIAVPGKDELTLTLDIAGTTVGLAHGHQMRTGKAAEWWAQQAHGLQPIGDATLLMIAHLHHLRVEQGGAKTVIQVPSYESESTWWRHRAGQVAPTGAVTMTVGGGGWDDLRIV
jgi:predicted phosphodiesterase